MSSNALSLEDFLPYRLSYTANLVSELVAGAYRALFQLTIPEWRVIAHAAEHQGVSQQEICRRTRMDKVTVSRAAAALTQRGLLERRRHAEDKRSHLLLLSAAGRQLYDHVAPQALELERRVFGDFAPEELDALLATLRRIDARTLQELAKP